MGSTGNISRKYLQVKTGVSARLFLRVAFHDMKIGHTRICI